MKTNEITKKYNITRQTLNNWMKEGKISRPAKDKRLAYVWEAENEEEIQSLISEEAQSYTIPRRNDPLHIGNRRYLGSKQRMLDFISKIVDENLPDIETVADIFGGTGVVADMFRKRGKNVIVNDILYSNYVSFQTWFSNETVDIKKVTYIIEELNHLKPKKGYVYENFGGFYFSKDNAKKIDAIREKIETYTDLNQREYCMLLTSLLYAMDKVANTVGHYDAFRQKMDSHQPIYLKVPEYNMNSGNLIYNMDANKLVREIDVDLVYIDTPYNSRGYENAYHVLENIAEWKKPKVEGVAKKAVNRSEKGSDYTKSSAPQAFDDLIHNIRAKYILVSYNNMNKKGNSRSNAKISNDEIIKSLEKRGQVFVFATDFNAFTAGKSKITNHKEILYLCKVRQNKKLVKRKLVKSALNYTGGKHKLFPKLLPLFPEVYNDFWDLFAGGATVSLNVANLNSDRNRRYYLNDINSEVIGFYNYLTHQASFSNFITQVERAISYYGFSDTQKYGYPFYGMDSSAGVGNYNKDKFLQLREDYNNSNFEMFDKEILFYLLIIFGFNNQIRFNVKGEFNLPVGKRDFNKSMRKKIADFYNSINSHNFLIRNLDFRLTINQVKQEDFVYADPPYRISTATYNENGGWSLQDDLDLFDYLDSVHKKGAYFALSNVVIHNGKENKELISWASNYNLHVLENHYNNSNYQSRAKANETVEVLITNY
ncbi:Dam family site-specific DNA-(adenine-N6)-methyltransferase [Streptococcus sobrinus]|uniref:Dam family site-specific DNA-(adenine-N6)-methyltransferase n=3 Tax=Streptococcus sobrinus TaxID=1310 RepID=UPI0002FBB03D|nr:Dam family site-specific DNA-(adenine-N6)-methyltransferase [Streptococcus sobrinus]